MGWNVISPGLQLLSIIFSQQFFSQLWSHSEARISLVSRSICWSPLCLIIVSPFLLFFLSLSPAYDSLPCNVRTRHLLRIPRSFSFLHSPPPSLLLLLFLPLVHFLPSSFIILWFPTASPFPLSSPLLLLFLVTRLTHSMWDESTSNIKLRAMIFD